MKGLACCLLAGCLPHWPGADKGQLRLQRAPDVDSYVSRYPITAEENNAFWEDLLYVVSSRSGTDRPPAEGRGLRRDAQLRWNDAVRPLCGLFEELRQQHNSALTTLSEFEARMAELVAAASALTAKRPQMDAAIAGYRDAWDLQANNRGAEGTEAAAQVAQARQLMAAAAQTVERIIQEATTPWTA